MSAYQCGMVLSEMFMQFMESGFHIACLYPGSFDAGMPRGLLDPETLEPLPSFYMFKLFKPALGNELVESSCGRMDVPVVAVADKDGGKLWVYLLNKTADKCSTMVNIADKKIESCTQTSISPVDINADEVEKDKKTISFSQGCAEVQLPGFSLSRLTVELSP
jgi:hypothetical protein